ncbi:MAG: OmpA family protein [Candidatus Kapabacteria bacterium]|nr:OmpA family protein [Candidatus Kapabacteria bacterium]
MTPTRLCWFAAILITVTASRAQEQTVVNESFDTAPRSWTYRGAGAASPPVVDGAARLVGADTSAVVQYHTPVRMQAQSDWHMSCRLRQAEGEADGMYGMMFWADAAESYYEFSVQRSGRVRLRIVRGVFNEDVLPWRTIKPIAQNDWLELTIRKQQDAVTCFVNDQPIVTITLLDFTPFGDNAGVLVKGPQQIDVDRFSVVAMPPSPVNVVDGVDEQIKAVNLGSTINTAADESVDCLAPDGSMIFFSRTGHADNTPPITRSDIWVSTRRADGAWSKPVNLGAPVNNAGTNYAIAVTQDLNMLFVNGTYMPDGTLKRGMSVSRRTATGWSAPQPVTIKGFINNSRAMTSHIAADGSFMVLSIETPTTRGGNDLYLSIRMADGTWSEPQNMGDSVNTIGMEVAPFIAADGSSIYFASDGHRGFGGRDIFVIKRLDSSLANWSRPRNLGRGINTADHESFFNVSAKGDSAYFSSQFGSAGKSDIFSIAMPKGAKPEALMAVRGRVIDATTRQPVEADIIYEDLGTGTVAGTARSSPADGSYRVTLKGGVHYGVRAQTQGYYPLSNELDARGLEDYKEVEQDLELSPIVVNVAIRLNNVFFDTGKWELRPESFPELDRLTDFMRTNAQMEIHVSGHTDDVGKDADNLALSKKRAEAVRAYVVEKGIDGLRLSSEGYGETKPLSPNTTDDGRQRNRRVEFTITKK